MTTTVFSACGDSDRKERSTDTMESPVRTAVDLRNASLEGQMEIVRQAVGQDVDVNATGRSGRTPLMLASFNGHTDIVGLLLEQGAHVGASDDAGRTSLMFAASGSFPETVGLLLEWKADPNATDRIEGWTALMFAAAEGHSKVVRLLLDYGAKPSLKDKDGEAAIDFARNNNHVEVVELLEKIHDK